MTWITAKPKRSKARPGASEADIQRAILSALSARGYLVLKHLPPRRSTKRQPNLPGLARAIEDMRAETIERVLSRAGDDVKSGRLRGVIWRTPAGMYRWAYRSVKGAASGGFVQVGFPGLSDLSGLRLRDGRAVPLFIEVKRPGNSGRQPGQAEFLELVRAMGGVALIVSDVEQVLKCAEL